MIAADLVARHRSPASISVWAISRSSRRTPTVSPGELQRLRLATQLRAGLFGVLYVLDEPSAGLHPADAEAAARRARSASAGRATRCLWSSAIWMWCAAPGGSSTSRPGAGELGGDVLYSGPVPGLADIECVGHSRLPVRRGRGRRLVDTRTPVGHATTARDPLPQPAGSRGRPAAGGSTSRSPECPVRANRRSSCKVLGDVVTRHSRAAASAEPPEVHRRRRRRRDRRSRPRCQRWCDAPRGSRHIGRLVTGRPASDRTDAALGLWRPTPACSTPCARRSPRPRRRVAAGGARAGSRSTWPRAAARPARARGCLRRVLFLPGTLRHLPGVSRRALHRRDPLGVRYRDPARIAGVLVMTVEEASEFLADLAAAVRSLTTSARRSGWATYVWVSPRPSCPSGEAQRIKLATELQRPRRGHTLYVLDEPTPRCIRRCGPARSSVAPSRRCGQYRVVAEHDMRVVAGADWVIDLGPGAGDDGGRVVRAGPPAKMALDARAPHGAVSGALGAGLFDGECCPLCDEPFSRSRRQVISPSWASPSK